MISEQEAAISWSHPKAPALDLDGPTVPFRPFQSHWVEQPAIDLFRAAAEEFGDHTASEDLVGHLTFSQVWAACRRLAWTIDTAIPAGQPVGVLLPNEACYPVAVLACLGAGRPCVMIDRHHPDDRVAAIVRDAGLAAIILRHSDIVEGMLLPAGLRTIVIDDALQDGPVQDRLPDCWTSPDAANFIVYTSGSTGLPKGIVLSQRAVLHRAAQLVNAVHLRADDKVLSLASPSTIGGLQQIFEVMLSGASLVKLDLQRVGLRNVVQVVGARHITMMFSTPAVWRSVARLDMASSSLVSLRCIQSSGDTLLKIDLELIRRVLPAKCHILSVYGATEAPALLQWFVPSQTPDDESRVPAGYPLAGFVLALLDDAGKPVPDGEPGELVVKSAWMSLGIWRKGAVDSGPFEQDARDPFVPVYRTGDIVRKRSDGLFVPLGRKDRQIKMLGNRVELAEIETIIRRVPEVQDAAVIARRGDEESKVLAFLVPCTPGSSDLAARVRTQLNESLPAYMCPSHFFVIDEIPLVPGRKVDEAALLSLAAEHGAVTAKPSSPPGEPRASQKSMAIVSEAWRRVFGGSLRHDGRSFIEAGGDSLRLLQVVFHLERLCGRALPLDEFQAEMRQSEFALALDGLHSGKLRAPSPGLPVVFLLPGSGGDSPMLAGFRADCASAMTVHALGYPDLDHLTRGSFDDIVTHALTQIEQISPESSFMLAGYSFGGDVAYAVADRLLARGGQISALLILDTNAIDFQADGKPRKRNHWVHRFITLCRLVRNREWRVIMGVTLTPAVVAKPASLWLLRLSLMFRMPTRGVFFFYLTRHLQEQFLIAHRTKWMRTVLARRLTIPVVLFRSEETDADLGWQKRAETLTIIPVKGDHLGMLSRENAAALSKEFIGAVRSI